MSYKKVVPFDTYHDEAPLVFIVAPPGSGKSYFALGDDRVVDGDSIVAAALGWPDIDGTWYKEPIADEVQRANFLILAGAGVAMAKPIVFVGTFFPRPNTHYALVRISPAEAARNAADRIGHGDDPKEIIEQQQVLADYLPGLAASFKEFTNFDEAAAWAVKLVRTRPFDANPKSKKLKGDKIALEKLKAQLKAEKNTGANRILESMATKGFQTRAPDDDQEADLADPAV